MNRRERRRQAERQRILDRTAQDLARDRARLTTQARDAAAALRALDAPVADRLALVERAIASMQANPLTRVASKGAIAELESVRQELVAAS
jgi:gamma-glutamyl phosphate reductase